MATSVWQHVHASAFLSTPGAPLGLGLEALSVGPKAVAIALRPSAVPISPMAATWPSVWPLVSGTGAVVAACLMRSAKPECSPPVCGKSLVLLTQVPDESLVAMHTAGGRRKRLGVGGRVCMLTGSKKYKGITRTFSEKANKRYWRPNTRWKKFWWEREKKFVRLYVAAKAIRMVDERGLETMAREAGLDLYAWSKPHWMPGSRQPLALRIGYSAQSQKDKKLWPDYLGKLNKGRALADIMPDPNQTPSMPEGSRFPKPWVPSQRGKRIGTPPKRLIPDKMLPASRNNIV